MERDRLAAALVVVLAAAALAADDLPNGVGVVTPSGSVFTTEILAGDSDDYVFQGFPGMTLTAAVKASRSSLLVPEIVILRPDGSVVDDAEGLTLKLSSKSATARMTLDAAGWWKVRVRGVILSYDVFGNAVRSAGEYAVSVKTTAPEIVAQPRVLRSLSRVATISPAGDTDDVRFPGVIGQSLAATLKVPKGSSLVPLLQLVRPDGEVVATQGLGARQRSLVIARTLDVTGTWRLRVSGQVDGPAPPQTDLSAGAYTLSVNFSRVESPSLVPDANGQYRVTIPATGGATIGYTLAYSGTAPTLNSFADPLGRPVTGFPGTTSLRDFRLPDSMPVGDYVLTFDAPAVPPSGVTFLPTLRLPKAARKRVARLSPAEPVIATDGISPALGAAGSVVTVQVLGLVDPNAPNGPAGITVGGLPLDPVTRTDATHVRGTVPATLPEGAYDLVVTSTSGQAAARAGGFERIAMPTVTAIEPPVGPAIGGSEVTISGTGFRPGAMGVLMDGGLLAITPTYVDATTLRFTLPAHAPARVVFGVRITTAGLQAELTNAPFEYVSTPVITRLSPPLVPVLGGDTITLAGAYFSATDSVLLETATPGVYEDVSLSQATFVDFNHHRFAAPARPKGTYGVFVRDTQGRPVTPRPLPVNYYSFRDATAASGLGAPGPDAWDATTSALADIDGDGDADLILSRQGGATAAATSQTRVLHNNGAGGFTDVTAAVMPAAGADDWRADRVAAADVDGDGHVDLVLSTNSRNVPPAGRSHTRILMNEVRGGTGTNATDRVLRDRTIDVMAPPRTMKKYGAFGGPSDVYVSDDWRGLDLWVGDLDGSGGRLDLVLTHDEVKDDDNPNNDVFNSGVYCGNYCATATQSFQYSYTFYWGGSRTFTWDKNARGGLGRFRFAPNWFPRVSGPIVPPGGIPGGGIFPAACSPHYNSVCKDGFTPFTGKRVTVGDLDHDGKLDVAVVSDQAVQRRDRAHVPANTPLQTISSLQVGLQGFNPLDGAGITDVTAKLTALGLDLRGDALAIGATGYPDGNPYGTIALARSAPGTGLALKLLRFDASGAALSVSDASAAELPSPPPGDAFEATQVAFCDIDGDGDLDLVLMAPAAPGGTGTALRVLRNDEPAGTKGLFTRAFEAGIALAGGAERFDGVTLAIGDVTGDGLSDFFASRATTTGSGSQTRVLALDR